MCIWHQARRIVDGISWFFLSTSKITKPLSSVLERWLDGSANSMNENKMPDFESVDEVVEFFDNNDMGEYADEMPEAHFEIDIQRRSFLVAVDKELMKKLAEVAKAQHTSTEQL